jgi:hypothetical protein
MSEYEDKAREIGTALLNDFDNQIISRGIFIKRFADCLREVAEPWKTKYETLNKELMCIYCQREIQA